MSSCYTLNCGAKWAVELLHLPLPVAAVCHPLKVESKLHTLSWGNGALGYSRFSVASVLCPHVPELKQHLTIRGNGALATQSSHTPCACATLVACLLGKLYLGGPEQSRFPRPELKWHIDP